VVSVVSCLLCCVFVLVTVSFEDDWRSCLRKLWRERSNSDLTLLVDHTHIQAHKVVLMAQSQYFDKLLFGGMKERDEDVIEIKEVNNACLFEAVIESAYTGSITVTNTIQVFQIDKQKSVSIRLSSIIEITLLVFQLLEEVLKIYGRKHNKIEMY